MPSERRLIANEFIVMRLDDESTYPKDFDPNNNPYFLHIGRYDKDQDAIVPLKYVSGFPILPKNAGQAIYAEALMDPDFAAVICTGPAGSGKTYMATVYGYNACKNGERHLCRCGIFYIVYFYRNRDITFLSKDLFVVGI